MSIIFKCKTDEAYNIKVLAELLSNNLKTGCFEVCDEGIYLRMTDNLKKTLVDLYLDSENFSIFEYNYGEKLSLGLNLNHFHKMLKSVKKKDSLEMYITDEDINQLFIKTIPKEKTRVTTSGIKIQNIQIIDTEIPINSSKPINIISTDFQKMCKELTSIGSNEINISTYTYSIDFSANADDILKRSVRLGEYCEDDNTKTYTSTFYTDQFSRINKLAGLSSVLQIYPGNKETPLTFKSRVGNLGNITVYIKSIENNDFIEDSDSDSD